MPGKLHNQAHPPTDRRQGNHIILPAPSAKPLGLPIPRLLHHAPEMVRLRRVARGLQSLADPGLATPADLRIALFQLFPILGVTPHKLRVVGMRRRGEVRRQRLRQEMLVREASRAEERFFA